VKTITRGVPLRQRREQWTLQWKPGIADETLSVEFTVPGAEDLHVLNLERVHHVAAPGDEVVIAPLLASRQGRFLRVSTANAEGVLLPLRRLGEGDEQGFTMHPVDGKALIKVELLDRENKPLLREQVTVIVLPL
jgi:hypothetical protein